jgi:hypothetical protein
MLSLPAAIKVYLCTVPCDMRRSFDGLSMMAEHIVRANPLLGHLFVYCNKRTDRVKILYWDRDGWVIWYKEPIAEAIGYALNNWTVLRRYSEDGDLEIDNNGAERSLRGVAVARTGCFSAVIAAGKPRRS